MSKFRRMKALGRSQYFALSANATNEWAEAPAAIALQVTPSA
ncbi:MAG: hypothetical protein ACYC9L_02860 [Sulfuricaulis sp.]